MASFILTFQLIMAIVPIIKVIVNNMKQHGGRVVVRMEKARSFLQNLHLNAHPEVTIWITSRFTLSDHLMILDPER